MITDIPTNADFFASGISYLNLAWNSAIDLVLDLGHPDREGIEDHEAITDDYWARAQRPLSTAVALAQQGTEFLLKARVAQASPFLLLSGAPRDWPKGCERSDVPYAEFRTVDAQDLARVHDTVSPTRLSVEFREEFEKMRRVRNSLIHTISKGRRFAPKEVLRWVLHARLELASAQTWIAYRKEYLESGSPGGAFPDYNDCGWGPRVASEFRAAVDNLDPSECQPLLGVNKKQRFYYCLGCHWRKADLESHAKTAQLKPNSPDSTSLYCYACEETFQAVRNKCRTCSGNVIDEEGEICLSCGNPCRDPGNVTKGRRPRRKTT